MAVVLYKDGQAKIFEPESVHVQLEHGWSVRNGKSVSELRAKGKELGIKGYHLMKPETLEQKINDYQD